MGGAGVAELAQGAEEAEAHPGARFWRLIATPGPSQRTPNQGPTGWRGRPRALRLKRGCLYTEGAAEELHHDLPARLAA